MEKSFDDNIKKPFIVAKFALVSLDNQSIARLPLFKVISQKQSVYTKGVEII